MSRAEVRARVDRPPTLDHLVTMTTARGVYEHARLDAPRVEHGYCVDDNARALVVACRLGAAAEPDSAERERADRLARIYHRAVLGAAVDGGFVNRWDDRGGRIGHDLTGDHWGRATWGLAQAARIGPVDIRLPATAAALAALTVRSPWLRAACGAAIAAADLHRRERPHPTVDDALRDARVCLTELAGRPDDPWPWPEPRLTYGNAVIPEAMIAVGVATGDEILRLRGLHLLGWLVDASMHQGHLSPVPVDGRGPLDPRPGFDQQPIEAATTAEAAARAWRVTGDRRWTWAVERCHAWFLGDNDAARPMVDAESGGGFDGLHRDGVNLNQGAESTLAALATAHLALTTR